MNHLLIQEFSSKLRPNVEMLTLEIGKQQIDTKECLEKIKQIRSDLTHLSNLLKIEMVLQNEKNS